MGGQLGVYAQVAAVAFGIGAIVERSMAVFTAIKLAGAAYLVYLGVQAVRRRKTLWAALEAAVEAKSLRRIVRDGVVVGMSNPKSIVFFTAVLPQFVDRSAGHVPVQMLLLGLLFLAMAVLCDCTYALAAGTARVWLARSPRRLELSPPSLVRWATTPRPRSGCAGCSQAAPTLPRNVWLAACRSS